MDDDSGNVLIPIPIPGLLWKPDSNSRCTLEAWFRFRFQFQFQAYFESLIPIPIASKSSWFHSNYDSWRNSLIPIPVKFERFCHNHGTKSELLVQSWNRSGNVWFEFQFQAQNLWLRFRFQEFSKSLIPILIPVKSGIIPESESCTTETKIARFFVLKIISKDDSYINF